MPEDLKQVVDKLLATGAAQGIVKVDTGGVPAALVPAGYNLVSLESHIYNAHRDFPERKSGDVIVDESSSFLAYWGLFHSEDSQVFADQDDNKLLAVLDYHGVGEKQPQWKTHRCTLQLKTTDEWDEWTAENRKPKGQGDFAEFLEDHIPDIVPMEIAPTKAGSGPAVKIDGAGFVELARDLKAKADVSFDSKVVQESGSVRFGYTETVQGGMGAKGEVSIPDRFRISIPVYLGSAKVSIEVRLRYRINSGKLTMWYDLYRSAYVQRKAFEEVIATVEQGIGKKVFIGRM